MNFVNRKAFVLAGIFLAVALIVPTYILIMQNDADLDNLLRQGPNLNDETQLPSIITDIDQRSQFATSIAIAIEIAAVILFIMCLWFALKSTL